jgi:hypothetical protein
MIKNLINKIFNLISKRLTNNLDSDSLNQQLQIILKNQYKILTALNSQPKVNETGFRVYSEFEEDGMLLYIFSVIGFKTYTVVEMCCGDGSECMATNLILNHGFKGYLFDGDETNINLAKDFFINKKDCSLYLPNLRNAWITKDNVNDLLRQEGAIGEIDLFSLDMDGNDYWIWDSITEINPRVFICEIQNLIPKDQSLTIKYNEFASTHTQKGIAIEYRGASLLSMIKISNNRGYKLVAFHRHGFNLIFLRNDLFEKNNFTEITVDEVSNNYWSKERQKNWDDVRGFNWENV